MLIILAWWAVASVVGGALWSLIVTLVKSC